MTLETEESNQEEDQTNAFKPKSKRILKNNVSFVI